MYLDGWTNVDISSQIKIDEQCDLLNIPWSFRTTGMLDDCSVEEIFCSHFVEHIGDEFIPFMDECHRVLKVGGLFRIRSPYYTSIRCWQDPTHKRAISEATFRYFSAKGREEMGVGHYPIKADFDVEEMRFHFPTGMADLADEERKYLLQHAWNTAADIEVLLRKHDPDKQSMDRQENKVVLN